LCFGAEDNNTLFSTTNLGTRNYNITYGNPLKGLAATIWSPERAINHAIEFTSVGLKSVLKDFNTYDWTEFEEDLEATASRKHQLAP
jgi:hypothetical protein